MHDILKLQMMVSILAKFSEFASMSGMLIMKFIIVVLACVWALIAPYFLLYS